MRIFWFWLFLIIPFFINAQVSYTNREIIYLKDGSVLFGEIMEWKQGEYLKLKLRNAIELTIPAETIVKVVMKQPRATHERKSTPGVYGGGALGFGIAEEAGLIMTDAVLGYRFKPMFQFGLGLGAYQFEFTEHVYIFPVFADWRSDYSNKRFVPYTILRMGSGFGISANTFEERSYKPGILISPIVGIQLGRIGKGALSVEAGYIRYQGMYEELDNWWGGGVETKVRYTYQRWLFRLAIGF